MKKFFLLFALLFVISPVYAHHGIIGESLRAVMYICFGNEPPAHRYIPRDRTVVINNTSVPAQPTVVQAPTQPVNVSVVTPTVSTPVVESGHWEQHTSPLGYVTSVWIPDPKPIVTVQPTVSTGTVQTTVISK